MLLEPFVHFIPCVSLISLKILKIKNKQNIVISLTQQYIELRGMYIEKIT